jgi:hypothetical protein
MMGGWILVALGVGVTVGIGYLKVVHPTVFMNATQKKQFRGEYPYHNGPFA